mmetsp:Transcript_23980/g.36797  ORF Transcript_23980/g.36797 Transcript_23980/m.36797 type:complete len:277 (-) Transcript_23980:895-1725(-)|eukprot:CAMPEP_0170493322 /NCGR_PEP_ID=MMETSP0208-20121228/13713_1 /TAXON_ID=197538 /ORGANISM="Strombidium inclinatum, Strain S3" /LENGTH=276 /DNA_ID=CAMNT_0010769235 /DNA_START=710 /DNA_END=1540 /DNA_ORIENTATION=+
MKFILKNPVEDGGCLIKPDPKAQQLLLKKGKSGSKDVVTDMYLKNVFDGNESVNWNDVVSVSYDLVSSSDVKCPICMESYEEMVCPRITKCGHIFCWPCVLQYLDFERTHTWKRCPICFDAVYPLDLKNVAIKKNTYYKPGDKMTFDLIVRPKASVIAKNKRIEAEQIKKLEALEEKKILTPEETVLNDYLAVSKGKVQCHKLAKALPDDLSSEDALLKPEYPYQNNKLKLNSSALYLQALQQDLEWLQKDYKFKESCGDVELLVFVTQAIEQIQG